MKKQIIAACLIATMCTPLAACNRTDTASGDNTENVTIEWYYPGNEQADTSLVEEKINQLVEGVNLKLKPIDSGAYDEKMNMMMASGTPFDICFSGYVNTYRRGVSMGGFLKLNDYIDERPALKEAIPDYAWDAVTLGNGDVYAIPNLQIYAQSRAVCVLKEYAEKYNLDVSQLKRIGDIEPFLEKIKQNENDVYPFDPGYGLSAWTMNDKEQIIMGISSLAIKRGDPQAKVLKVYDSQEFTDGVTTLRDWYNKGYIRQDIASAQGTQDAAKKSVVCQNTYKPGLAEDYKLAHGDDIVYFVIDNPYMSANNTIQTLNAIGANCKHPKEAMQLLETIYTNEDVFRLLIHGIEGTHYEKIGDKHFKPINTDKYNNHAYGWMFGNQFMTLLAEGKPDDTWEETKRLNDESDKSPLLGFIVDTNSILNEIANVTAVESEFKGLSNGSMGPDSIQTYKKKLEEAGIDRIVEEVQKQIDEFIKEKK